MLRVVCNHVRSRILPHGIGKNFLNARARVPMLISRANIMKGPRDHDETDDEYEDRMECYFSRADIDGWEVRKGLNELAGMDAIPDPRVLAAALCACRRVNDYAMTTRVLEMLKCKCGPHADTLYPCLLEHIQPVLEELGIDTPEKLGYGKPELALADVHQMH